MNISFKPVNRSQANEYVSWQYPDPYSIYNFQESDKAYEVECMLKEDSKSFAVFNEEEFVGVRSFGDDGKVPGGTYDNEYQDTGGALRPDLTGKGLGERVIRAGLTFGANRFGFDRYRVTVAAFNERALTVCKRIGFTESLRFQRETDGETFVILLLESFKKTS